MKIDPELIKKKNAMRMAFREEYLRKVFNPYRHAAGVGGAPVRCFLNNAKFIFM